MPVRNSSPPSAAIRFLMLLGCLSGAGGCDTDSIFGNTADEENEASRATLDPSSKSAPPPKTSAANEAPDDAALATADEKNTISIFERAAPSTVFVTQNKLVLDRWSRRSQEVTSGTGSGFVWDDAGHIVTNFHVIDGATSLSVTLLGGDIYPATFVGGDATKDLAVIKVDMPRGKKLTPLRRPSSAVHLRVGQKTLAIGNPFGLDHTLTTGVISALGRQVRGFSGIRILDMIQTDATINPGNSGGPLLNSAGELIGINTMTFSTTGNFTGIGFAVPVKTVERIVPQLIKHGAPLRVGLGVSVVPDQITKNNGLRGVVIEAVPPGSAAAKAGLRGLHRDPRGTRLGDIILGIDDQKVENFDDLFTALDARSPGDQVRVSVQRDETLLEIKIALQKLSGE